ncbi:hypothetical protein [Rhizorhabdus sp.]|uniref:hypothetical protein n=1 Tax=Rhizorhabdus sp. TaxID=1968843 RepID=UPI0019A9EA95|nr:hypothetical protein [Rhizorhabdus sp.]MBD3762598.1 hypothetical protein [Rhizorhabdus sp.]
MKNAAGPWTPIARAHPPENRQVLVRLRESVGGGVCDVACFVGRQPDGEMRWIMADVRLDSRQIVEWALIGAEEQA